jgi:hypothetical protein
MTIVIERVDVEHELREAYAESLRYIQEWNLGVNDEAEADLKEMILDGFRRLQELRVLDLPGPEQEEAFRRARRSLQVIIEEWVALERVGGMLTSRGLRRAKTNMCSIYPCRE